MAIVKFSVFCGVEALLIVAPPAACSATSSPSSAGYIPDAYGPQFEGRKELLQWLQETGPTNVRGSFFL